MLVYPSAQFGVVHLHLQYLFQANSLSRKSTSYPFLPLPFCHFQPVLTLANFLHQLLKISRIFFTVTILEVSISEPLQAKLQVLQFAHSENLKLFSFSFQTSYRSICILHLHSLDSQFSMVIAFNKFQHFLIQETILQ